MHTRAKLVLSRFCVVRGASDAIKVVGHQGAHNEHMALGDLCPMTNGLRLMVCKAGEPKGEGILNKNKYLISTHT